MIAMPAVLHPHKGVKYKLMGIGRKPNVDVRNTTQSMLTRFEFQYPMPHSVDNLQCFGKKIRRGKTNSILLLLQKGTHNMSIHGGGGGKEWNFEGLTRTGRLCL